MKKGGKNVLLFSLKLHKRAGNTGWAYLATTILDITHLLMDGLTSLADIYFSFLS